MNEFLKRMSKFAVVFALCAGLLSLALLCFLIFVPNGLLSALNVALILLCFAVFVISITFFVKSICTMAKGKKKNV